MVSNYGILYNDLICLVQGRYGLLIAQVNGRGLVVGDKYGNRSGSVQCGHDGTG